jgi:hypothetical protein
VASFFFKTFFLFEIWRIISEFLIFLNSFLAFWRNFSSPKKKRWDHTYLHMDTSFYNLSMVLFELVFSGFKEKKPTFFSG